MTAVTSARVVGTDGLLLVVRASVIEREGYGDEIQLADTSKANEAAARELRVRVRSAVERHTSAVCRPVRLEFADNGGGPVKPGAANDLAAAVAVLAARGAFDAPEGLIVGELSLGGELRPVRGVVPLLRAAERAGLPWAIVPEGNGDEAQLADVAIPVYPARHLRDVIAHLDGSAKLMLGPDYWIPKERHSEDFAEVRGLPVARRALEIAAAGGHNVLLVGSPGSGKTMLARRLRTILPDPTRAERAEIVNASSAAGLGVPASRPFRAPHHTCSAAALVGGGDPVRPGEVTLAHGGVLFIDELPELRKDAIESLTHALEAGVSVVARTRSRCVMPAKPAVVVGACNPCPCGYEGDPKRLCSCTPERIAHYRKRVPRDTFDLVVQVDRVPIHALRATSPAAESSETIRARVVAARERLPKTKTSAPLFDKATPAALALLDGAVERTGLSARQYVKALRVARTIAALDGADEIGEAHVAEALTFCDTATCQPGHGAERSVAE